MAERWMTVQEGAYVLGVSERTVWNRIKKDRYETRTSPEGRREVLVDAPDQVAPVEPQVQVPVQVQAHPNHEIYQEQLAAYKEASQRQVEIAETTVDMARDASGRIHRELTAARRVGWAGWGVTQALMILLAITGWFVSGAISDRDALIFIERARADRLEQDLTTAYEEITRVATSVTAQTTAVANAEPVNAQPTAKDTPDPAGPVSDTDKQLAEHVLRELTTAHAEEHVRDEMHEPAHRPPSGQPSSFFPSEASDDTCTMDAAGQTVCPYE